MHSLAQIAGWCNAQVIGKGNVNNINIQELCTDSREVVNAPQAIFIALVTTARNAHQYLQSAYKAGIRSFLVSEMPEEGAFKHNDVMLLLVPDTLVALQAIAAAHRRLFTHTPVVGITGSNGKTIVKEWLFELLCTQYEVVRSPRSYNSQIGVPLSIWQMNEKHQIALFEAGISQRGEMQHLEKMLKPTIGIFTNIGEAHSAGFDDVSEKINEKLILFKDCSYLIFHDDDSVLQHHILRFLERHKNIKPITWGAKAGADIRLISAEKNDVDTVLKIDVVNDVEGEKKHENLSLTIPFTDDASIENAMHCICASTSLNVPFTTLSEVLKKLPVISHRLERINGINNCILINDSYNSDLTSFKIALNVLEKLRDTHTLTLIISDFLQAGSLLLQQYEEVARLIAQKGITKLYAIGEVLHQNSGLFRSIPGLACYFYKDTTTFLSQINTYQFQREAILIKGARQYGFEHITQLLQQQVHQTKLTVFLNIIEKNLHVYRSLLSADTKIMVMVKAFAYGTGSTEIASLLQHAGVHYLAVAYTDEGIALRQAGIHLPIMVMNPDIATFSRMIAWRLEPELYSRHSLEAFMAVAQSMQCYHYPVHLKLDTGMHRLGFEHKDLPALTSKLNSPYLLVASLFSHLAASEAAEYDRFTMQQAQQFDAMCATLTADLGYTPLLHICNSAGIVRHKALHYSMVRIGLGLYGVDVPTNGATNILESSMKLTTTIAQIKSIALGESVGYGRKYIAEKPIIIATVNIGYGDGYSRRLGNGNGYMLLKGKKAPTVGNICMDMCMIDISHIPDAEEGDEVLVFGNGLPIEALASMAGTISYELMTSISQRVKRIYVMGND
ncbi:MAG: bifunctional UDP-N-acetylmuramoyl-tripeptide:D-alanyl-D-alanine ligase/alanine racemase [Chitinophagia bacterium]|nr:bifunctional UDP-N-acetylmuramoyl-tripeptide:D-alanyl-D-alanine ligase/alanine racemase [Chitinophagia bacterium]